MRNTKLGMTAQGKHVRFTKVAFGYHGNWFIAGDQHGNLYHFDIDANRWGQPCLLCLFGIG